LHHAFARAFVVLIFFEFVFFPDSSDVAASAIVFTGNATADFANVSNSQFYSHSIIPVNGKSHDLSCTSIVCLLHFSTTRLGFQFSGIWINYDRQSDVMSFGFECGDKVCGDADNDGDPNVVDTPGFIGADIANWGIGEYLAMSMWTGAPAIEFDGFMLHDGPLASSGYLRYYPQLVIGFPFDGSIADFGVFFLDNSTCAYPFDGTTLLSQGNCWESIVENAYSNFGRMLESQRFATTLFNDGQSSVTMPHIEWSIGNFSKLPGNVGDWSYDHLEFSWHAQIGSTPDLLFQVREESEMSLALFVP
jgi:hypothetical protein